MMRRFLFLIGFVVFWRQWEWVPGERNDVVLYNESKRFDKLGDARDFVRRIRKDERFTDMHIYRMGEEVQ
jgi:hypothetical protein